jgi:hypothetical protein
MSTLIITAAAVVATAYIWYVTIQGYRTGVLNLRGGRIDRRLAPRRFSLMIVLVTVLSLVCLVAVAIMIYGETHPDWRRAPAKHALKGTR